MVSPLEIPDICSFPPKHPQEPAEERGWITLVQLTVALASPPCRLRTWPPEGGWENEVHSQPSAPNLPVAPASFLESKRSFQRGAIGSYRSAPLCSH